MKVSEMKPSKYMKALVDVPKDAQVPVTITGVSREDGQDDNGKTYTLNLLHVQEFDKPLKLNSGMLDAISDLHSDETDAWRGKRIALYATVERFGGKKYDVIRIADKVPA
jgi:hypothetical protein